MSSMGARKQLAEANRCAGIAKAVLKRFRIDNAPGLKYVEAREYYDRAARAYAAGGKPEFCADAYDKCADMSARLSRGSTLEAVYFHVRCGELLEENDPTEACAHYADACDGCCDLGEWATAAELRYRIAALSDFSDDANGIEDRILALRGAADMFGAAASRLHDETKHVKRRQCALQAAALEALGLGRYSKAAEVFEGVATEIISDNLVAANATRLFFKSALCSLVAGEHDLMRGKLEIFADRFLEFGAAPERQFLLDVNAFVAREPLPDYDAFTDAVYAFCTVRELDVWDLKMLKILDDAMNEQYEAHYAEEERVRAKALRREKKHRDAKERARRIARDEDARRKDKQATNFL
jgi:hypothetical protein